MYESTLFSQVTKNVTLFFSCGGQVCTLLALRLPVRVRIYKLASLSHAYSWWPAMYRLHTARSIQVLHALPRTIQHHTENACLINQLYRRFFYPIGNEKQKAHLPSVLRKFNINVCLPHFFFAGIVARDIVKPLKNGGSCSFFPSEPYGDLGIWNIRSVIPNGRYK